MATSESHPSPAPECSGTPDAGGPEEQSRLLTIFDWDDTLLCSTYVQQSQLLQVSRLSPATAEQLARVEAAAVRVLRLALKLGPVVIITNAEAGWVELSAEKYYRDVVELLSDIPVVSARSQFESQFPGAPLSWKAAAFAYVLHERFSLDVVTPRLVVSVGDSDEEKIALRIAAGQHTTIQSNGSMDVVLCEQAVTLACNQDDANSSFSADSEDEAQELSWVLKASIAAYVPENMSVATLPQIVYPQQQQQQAPPAARHSPPSPLRRQQQTGGVITSPLRDSAGGEDGGDRTLKEHNQQLQPPEQWTKAPAAAVAYVSAARSDSMDLVDSEDVNVEGTDVSLRSRATSGAPIS
ncbi:hypothetical protein JKP88DRAFT_354483 [Tribonema minus]|uniref:Uncharacterized protein n=1 Tax=Tribonema minus TaxID=303371 RepID=A0A835Z397_9STRA|nr:hypothetical protein JKP88DRAFT_354483 [Tribonema minus]